MKLFILATALLSVISAEQSEHAKWESFKETHNKLYHNEEEQLRFKVFKESLIKINEHNSRYAKGEESYFLTTTKFADWTDEEFSASLNPLLASNPRMNYTKTFVADPEFTRPSSVDWRSQAVLEVKVQGNCGGCWAFSTTGALEGQLAIHRNKKTPLSEQNLIDCVPMNAGCSGGSMVAAFFYVQKHGISSEDEYKYTAVDGDCKTVDSKEIESLSGYVELPQSEDSLADAVAQIGPISIAVEANNNFKLYGGGIFDDPSCSTALNHAVLAVGYEDNYWIIKNSWGPDWGENGYIRLVRGKNQCGLYLQNSYPEL